MPKNFRQRRTTSTSSEEETVDKIDESSGSDQKVDIKEKIEELKFLQKQRQRTHGIDVYSLAIGESSESTLISKSNVDNDPWKSKTGGLVDMKLLKEKRGNEIVKNMNSNFARETNQRDEDAEMQKFIEEQLRLKKEAEKPTSSTSANNDSLQSSNTKKYKSPEDALFDVPKYLIESHSKSKQVELLSDQMLSGIPEVELGVDERIRNIEETERARQELLKKQNAPKNQPQNTDEINAQYAPQNTSVNFVQHKRFDDALINPDRMIKPRMPTNKTKLGDNNYTQPVVGDAPKHELLADSTSTSQSDNKITHKKASKRSSASSSNNNNNNNNNTERASDDYCLERFRKNMKFSRTSKIKIA